MPPKSATEALNAGIERWKRLLFHNFRWGLLLKLSFVALLAELSGGGGFNGNWRLPNGRAIHQIGALGNLPHALHAGLFAFLLIVGFVSFVVGIVVFYLACRMKFVEFHLAATGETAVAQPWNRYGPQTWKLFWLTLAIDIVALAVLAAVATPMVLAFLHHNPSSGGAGIRHVFALVVVFLPLLLAWVLALQLVLMVVRDFMLPAWVLENATVGQSWALARRLMEQDLGAFVRYTLLKVAVRIGIGIASAIPMIAVLVISAVPFMALAVGAYAALHRGGPGAMALLVAIYVFEALFGLGWIVLVVSICSGAPAWIFQCYSVEWLAGRYAPLAQLMYPPPPPEPAPVVPSADLPPPEDGWAPATS